MNVENTMINFTNWLPILVIIGILFLIIWKLVDYIPEGDEP